MSAHKANQGIGKAFAGSNTLVLVRGFCYTSNGFIQFGVLGDVGCKGRFWASVTDENTVTFQKKNEEIAEKIKLLLSY